MEIDYDLIAKTIYFMWWWFVVIISFTGLISFFLWIFDYRSYGNNNPKH